MSNDQAGHIDGPRSILACAPETIVKNFIGGTVVRWTADVENIKVSWQRAKSDRKTLPCFFHYHYRIWRRSVGGYNLGTKSRFPVLHIRYRRHMRRQQALA